jgi:hypothetical protein
MVSQYDQMSREELLHNLDKLQNAVSLMPGTSGMNWVG